MPLELLENQMVKCIGASGQISLGKEFAGRTVLVDSPAKGVWIIRTATIIPDNEAWLHDPRTRQTLKKSLKWALAHPATASDPDQLPGTGSHARKRRARSA